MPSIQKISAVSAKNVCSVEQVLQAVRPWLKDAPKSMELFSRLSHSAQIESRSFILPIDEILSLDKISLRAQIFKDHGVELGRKVLIDLSEQQDLFDTLITSSCSVPILPGLDSLLAERLNLSPALKRIPFYQHGCAGGVLGLSLASRLAQKKPVAVVSVELCSLVHRLYDLRPEQILGTVIFGDGAGGAIVSADEMGPLRILDTQTHRIAATTEDLGYSLEEDGAHLRISKQLPDLLQKALPECLSELLSRNALKESQIRWWLSHPGGAKILSTIEQVVGCHKDQQRWSWRTLSESGNISSAGIFHVLKNFIDENCYRDGELAVIIGIGPGVTLEAVLVECKR